jgi:class 3 adenylate cyclase/tetratricopeptide (TPR) repeat protein
MSTTGIASAEPSRCGICSAENPSGSRFCNSCGASLEGAVSPREERRLVSVLFVDLVGFTARSDRADPEDVRELLQLYHAEAKRRIEHFGGVLEKFIGDAVMAVFGAPVAHGDDAERAVRAGLRVLEGIEMLNRVHDLDLEARAAVNTGDAVVSLERSSEGEALATGDVVNSASRLQSAAPSGRVIVGAETYRATRHAIGYDSVGAVDAKGKAEPLTAWLATEPRVSPGERSSTVGGLVGRVRELDLVRSLWAGCLSEHHPQLVTLVGPPGIGKSRLCLELSGLVRSEGGQILQGRCLPYEEQTGYQAFSRLVHAASGIFESDAPAVAREKLSLAVETLMPESESTDAARYLALLLGLAPDDEVPGVQLLYFAARRFIECIGMATPTVFVFEDIHWAQESEVALLEYLARHLRDAPVMLVATARPEMLDARPTWGSGFAATTIPLAPLPAADAEELVGQLVQAAGGRDFDVTRVVDIGGGNPLFLEELAASVIEVGDTDALPITVREAIAARLDAVPPAARATLLSAAIVGKTFWRGALPALAGIDDVDEPLALLEARDLIRRDPSSELAGDVQFTFKHMLIREVAYSTLPRAARRERHAAVARYIEETFPGAAETLPAILAYHWREAGEPDRAIFHLLAAADAARRSWAQAAVTDLYGKALELATTDDLRRSIRLQRGLALVELGEYSRAAEELGELLPQLAGRDRLDALIALGHAYLWTERDLATLETAAQAVALVDEVDDATALPAVLAMESQGLAMRGAEGDLDKALELGDRALDLWVPGSRALDLRHHLHLHADTTYWMGEYGRSVELSRQTRSLATNLHSAESLLRGGGAEALALTGLGQHEAAIAIWDELFEIARELGRSPQVLLNYSSVAYRELHDLDEARRRSEHALELSAEASFGMPRQFAGSDLLLTDLLAGDVGGAQTLWPSLWKAAENATAWTTWLIAGRLALGRAEIALHAEPVESAVEWAKRSLDIARRTRRRKYEARSLTVLGHAYAAAKLREEALESLQSAVAIADVLIGAPARWTTRAALGEVAYALGDDDTAATSYAEAADLVESFATTLAAERAACLLAAPPIEQILTSAGRTPR